MFPREDLTDLDRRKRLLQARIALNRLQCTAAAAELARPLAVVDRGVTLWRRVSPLVKLFAVPAGLLLGRSLGGRRAAGRRSRFGMLLTVLPLVWRGARLFMTVRAAAAAGRPPAGARPPR